jgi:uncharacterized protein YndB with AHSA1/START domain
MSAKKPFVHGSFTVERTYDASPERIFRAFSEQGDKYRWFACHDDWPVLAYSLDFRVGGREHYRGKAGGLEHQMDAYYWDIVPNERIIWAYEMHVGGEKISVSLNTIRLEATGKKTRMTFTEQGTYFWKDDDLQSREVGTREILDALGRELAPSDGA